MREPLFVDTGYIIALINENDNHHRQALRLAERHSGYPLVTTNAVLLETGNALSRIARHECSQLIHAFQEADEMTLIHMNPVLFKQAVNLFARYQDKTWGLVDCLSFVVMREMQITTALTFDHHFEQAGFRCAE
jgi:hypothetical protein